MKKITGLIFTLIFCTALSSCSENRSQNTLTISGIGISNETDMFDFYKTIHPETELIIEDYDQYGSEALNRLNIDIIKNKAGDILYSSGHIDIDSLITNNVLENLENEETLSETINKLIPSIKDSCKASNGIFFVYPYFNIECYICKEKYINEGSWCRDSIINTISQYIDSDIALFDEHPDTHMTRLISDCILDDIHNSTFEKNTSFYIKLINTCKQVYDKNNISQSSHNDDYRFRNEKVIIKREIINNLNCLFINEKGNFNDNISILGSPQNENTIKFGSGCYLSIFNQSPHKQQAAEFIKTFLEDDYQMSITYEEMALPVSEKAFNKMTELSLSWYDIDETGQQTEKRKNKVCLNGNWIDLGYPEKEQLNRYVNLIYNNHYAHYVDYHLQEIVNTELSNIWQGDNSAEMIIETLQKKINIYISESQ